MNFLLQENSEERRTFAPGKQTRQKIRTGENNA
jgi:hypothetical protein